MASPKTRELKLVEGVIIHSLIGSLIGFLVLHPVSMVITGFELPSLDVLDLLEQSFSFEHVPMAIYFSMLGTVFGAIYGFYAGRLAKEISERKRVEDALRKSERKYRELSITDSLTGLYNSRHFFNQLRSEIERATRYSRPLSLLLIDIDNFKRYNDIYGHLEGDKVLAKLGEVIRQCIRRTDSGFRYGGEEFTVILPEIDSQEAFYAAERIRNQFENKRAIMKTRKTCDATVSIGIAQYVAAEELSLFVGRADEAMYMAKERGKNRVFFLKSNDRRISACREAPLS